MPITVRVWDLPIRLFHWALVICIIGSFVTVKLGGLWMDWHVRFGLIALGLIVFRIIWGLFGPRYARFSHFLCSPAAILKYLKGEFPHTVGHNPAGALSVVAMLVFIGFQAFSGLFANDDVLTTGPLAYLSSDWSDTLTGLHKQNELVLIALIGLHIAAIIWYRWIRKVDLIGPMIHGDTQIDTQDRQAVPSAQDSWKVRTAALVLALAIGLAIWWLQTLTPAASY